MARRVPPASRGLLHHLAIAEPPPEPIMRQHDTKLTEQRRTDHDVERSIREPAVEQFGAGTRCDGRRDQHIRVKNDLHRAA